MHKIIIIITAHNYVAFFIYLSKLIFDLAVILLFQQVIILASIQDFNYYLEYICERNCKIHNRLNPTEYLRNL